MSSTRYARQTFIYSAISYLRDRNFDGLDIDWEYPKGGDDKKNYVLLLKGKYRINANWILIASDSQIIHLQNLLLHCKASHKLSNYTISFIYIYRASRSVRS